MNCTFQRGVVIATFLSVLGIVPCHCARLTYFLHPKLRKISVMLIAFTYPVVPAAGSKRSQRVRRPRSPL